MTGESDGIRIWTRLLGEEDLPDVSLAEGRQAGVVKVEMAVVDVIGR
jgi:hypothetical protein